MNRKGLDMIFGIIANGDRDIDFVFSRYAAKLIREAGCEVVVDPSFQHTSLGTDPHVTVSGYENCDLIFCIGGDGTFLVAVHEHFAKEKPFIGINQGSIGFLTEIQPEQFPEALKRLINKDYTIDDRMQLDVSVYDKNGHRKTEGICMNDVVIARGQLLKVFSMDLFVDGDYVECLSGDGVILSTPTGSTAYSLAAGGPIVKPEIDVILITPICPHTLHNRSYVVSPDSKVELRIATYSEPPLISLDGRNGVPLELRDRIVVSRSNTPMKIARLGELSFYQTIRKKIHARGSFYEDEQK